MKQISIHVLLNIYMNLQPDLNDFSMAMGILYFVLSQDVMIITGTVNYRCTLVFALEN